MRRLPCNTVATEDFEMMIQRATADWDATILAASTCRDFLTAVFAKVCEMTKALLL